MMRRTRLPGSVLLTLLCVLLPTAGWPTSIQSDKIQSDKIESLVAAELQRVATEEDQVRYRGQYAALVPLGSAAGQFLLSMLLDEDRPLATRRRAANALHDVATSDLLEPLRQAMGDLLLEPWVETEVGLLLARLGDRQTLDRWIRQLRRVTDRIPTTVTLAEILEGLGRLGDLQFRSIDLGAATATHRRRIALMKDLIPRVPERLQKPLNDEMQAIHYNLACCLALTDKIDAAFEATEQSLRSPTIRITMVQVDGDLRALREDARWSDWLSNLIEDKVPASQTPEAEEQRR